MEILASLPTSSPQYVQVDDSEPLGRHSNRDKLAWPPTQAALVQLKALSGEITCDPPSAQWESTKYVKII